MDRRLEKASLCAAAGGFAGGGRLDKGGAAGGVWEGEGLDRKSNAGGGVGDGAADQFRSSRSSIGGSESRGRGGVRGE